MIDYDSMTEQERKDHFGYCVKRGETTPEYSEAWTCLVNQAALYSGQGVYDIEEDNPEDYQLSDLKKYVSDYPEMVLEGWFKPYNDFQNNLIKIRTSYVYSNSSDILKELYSTLKYKYTDDDMWNGWSETPLITFNETNLTCDEATVLYSQYVGDDDVKASELISLRTSAKNYLRELVTKFLEDHSEKPEMPEFEREYIN